jgi:hypothetical protein
MAAGGAQLGSCWERWESLIETHPLRNPHEQRDRSGPLKSKFVFLDAWMLGCLLLARYPLSLLVGDVGAAPPLVSVVHTPRPGSDEHSSQPSSSSSSLFLPLPPSSSLLLLNSPKESPSLLRLRLTGCLRLLPAPGSMWIEPPQ